MKKLLTIAYIAIIAACNHNNPTAKNDTLDDSNLSPISLYNVGSLNRSINSVDEMEALTFDIELGTIYKTEAFYFIIKNNSTSEIKNLKFTFDMNYFKITPDTIISLGVPEKVTSIEQIIKITVEHGTLESGLGNTDVLTGDQYGTLSISGSNDDGEFNVSYVIHANAKRMVVFLNKIDTFVYQYYNYANPNSSNLYVIRDVLTDTINTLIDTMTDSTKYKLDNYTYLNVDSLSNDCYIDIYNENQVINNETGSINITSTKNFANTAALTTDWVGNPIDLNTQPWILNGIVQNDYMNMYGRITDTTMLNSFITHHELYNSFINNTDNIDANCVTLIVDNINNISYILK